MALQSDFNKNINFFEKVFDKPMDFRHIASVFNEHRQQRCNARQGLIFENWSVKQE